LVARNSSGNGAQIHARPLIGGRPVSENAQTFVLPREKDAEVVKQTAASALWAQEMVEE
jgi:hypothetical protein